MSTVNYPWLRDSAAAYAATIGICFGTTAAYGWTGAGAVAFCVAFSLLPAGFVYWRWRATRRDFDGFFGLSKNSLIKIVVSTYRIKHDPLTKQQIYYKTHSGGGPSAGAEGYHLGLQTATTAILSVIELGKLTNQKLNVVGDEEPGKMEGPVISLGSTTTNVVTGEIIHLLPNDLTVVFDSNSLRCWLHPDPYKSDKNLDYAVLIRVRRDNQVSFACAGIDEEGTVALATHLLVKWRNLPLSNFIQIFSCCKKTLQVKPLSEPKNW